MGVLTYLKQEEDQTNYDTNICAKR